jgi:hypothetical protein
MDVVPAAMTLASGRASAAVVAAGLAAVMLSAACFAPADSALAVAPLSNTFDSPDALAQAVLAALARRDLNRLRSLALTESEFRDHVWPELPASRPERKVPFGYAWGQLKQRSDGYLQQTFARHAGKPLTFVRTAYTGETTPYTSFAVMRESEVIAADATGRELVLRLYGSAMVKDGRYKLFSYVIDD